VTTQIRVLIALVRPPVLLLLALFGLLGLAQAGAPDDRLRLAAVLVVVAGYLLCSVAVNDIADEAVDRVNLAGDRSRPLVSDAAAGRRHLLTVALTAAVVAFGAAASLGRWPVVALVAGLALSLAYSLPPTRLSARGAVASLLLPAGYVAVPFLVGRLALGAAGPALTARDGWLLAGLYVGFIGRILLKDFRDVIGDAQFGKRTFLVRHGRATTCRAAAIAWVAGNIALAGVRDLTPGLVAAQVASTVAALVLLRGLSRSDGHRRDEWLISALAIVGRGSVLTVIAHLGMSSAGWSTSATGAMALALSAVTLGLARSMVRHGPRRGLQLVPPAWSAAGAGRQDERVG
jgi:4-hydroxybenzoate polyprenyltransferase